MFTHVDLLGIGSTSGSVATGSKYVVGGGSYHRFIRHALQC